MKQPPQVVTDKKKIVYLKNLQEVLENIEKANYYLREASDLCYKYAIEHDYTKAVLKDLLPFYNQSHHFRVKLNEKLNNVVIEE